MTALNEETYYEILKVDPKASIPEIVAAYHRAKSAFSSDSIATYSLLDGEESKEILKKIEEAYHVLTNVEKRAEYDRILHVRAEEADTGSKDPFADMTPNEGPNAAATSFSQPDTPLPPAKKSTETLESVTGEGLREIREARGFSLEDVARITKIQKKYLRAIEESDIRVLPARVYVHGFVKNIASLYRLDTEHTTEHYLKLFDELSGHKMTGS